MARSAPDGRRDERERARTSASSPRLVSCTIACGRIRREHHPIRYNVYRNYTAAIPCPLCSLVPPPTPASAS